METSSKGVRILTPFEALKPFAQAFENLKDIVSPNINTDWGLTDERQCRKAGITYRHIEEAATAYANVKEKARQKAWEAGIEPDEPHHSGVTLDSVPEGWMRFIPKA